MVVATSPTNTPSRSTSLSIKERAKKMEDLLSPPPPPRTLRDCTNSNSNVGGRKQLSSSKQVLYSNSNNPKLVLEENNNSDEELDNDIILLLQNGLPDRQASFEQQQEENASSVKKLLQTFEEIDHENKEQNQVLVKKNKQKRRSKFGQWRMSLVNAWNNGRQGDLCFQVDDDDIDIDMNHPSYRHYIEQKKQYWRRVTRWQRIWQSVYAILAVLELSLCFQAVAENETMTKVSTEKPSGVGYNYWIHSAISSMAASINIIQLPSWWQDFVNIAFMIAISIHTLIESIRWASRRNQEQRNRLEAAARSQTVTCRTRQRNVVYETTSSNRHFIMRWTDNRIPWSRATTEILRVALLVLLLRLLFLPVLKENPFSVCFGAPSVKSSTTKTNPQRLLSVGECIISIFHSAAALRFKKQVKTIIIRFIKHLLKRPWKASFRVQRAFTVIRWLKFLAPLVGTCNKLRGHVSDYRMKKELRDRSERANQSWESLVKSIRTVRRQAIMRQQLQPPPWDNLGPSSPSNDNIDLTMAVVKIQHQFRQRARITRQQAARDRRRLSDIGLVRQVVSVEHCQLAKRLRRKLARQDKSRRRQLLLRPNTRLAVRWKRVTIACVLLEVSQLLIALKLSPKSLKKVPVEELIHFLLAPSNSNRLPWLHLWQVAVVWIAWCTARVVSIVSFMDVFITLFTGQISSTGQLVPRPFFARWILPGVCLQLIVNPTLKDISQLVQQVLRFAKKVGPMRILHVGIAILPVLQAMLDTCIDGIFTLVEGQNRRATTNKKKVAAESVSG